MQKTIIENCLEYILVGDCFLPNPGLPEEPRPIGKWADCNGSISKRRTRFYSTTLFPADGSGPIWLI